MPRNAHEMPEKKLNENIKKIERFKSQANKIEIPSEQEFKGLKKEFFDEQTKNNNPPE